MLTTLDPYNRVMNFYFSTPAEGGTQRPARLDPEAKKSHSPGLNQAVGKGGAAKGGMAGAQKGILLVSFWYPFGFLHFFLVLKDFIRLLLTLAHDLGQDLELEPLS